MTQKVYLLRKSYLIFLVFLLVWLFAFIFFWFILSPSPNIQPIAYLFLVGAFVMPPLAAALYIEKIVFDGRSMVLQRKFRPITINKITDLETLRRGGVEGLKITGSTPDGRKVRKNVWEEGDVGKRWAEFKADLQKIKSK